MKIKAKISFLLIIIALSTAISCKKFMDIVPPDGLIRQQFWNSKEEVQQVLMGTYAAFAQLDDEMFRYGEMRSDMVTYVGYSWNEIQIINGNIYPDNGFTNWAGFYQVINYCNEVIKNAPIVRGKDNTFTDYQLKGYLSEAYFLRSLSYYYLVRIFKDVPLVLEPSESDNVDFYLPKSDADTVLNHIVSDLKEYRNYATVDGYLSIKENKGRATKAAFDALLADISLWRFDYGACIGYVQNIEDSKKYELLPMDKWFDNYYPGVIGTTLENIFEFQYNPDNNFSNNIYGLTSQSSTGYRPSLKAGELFSPEADIEVLETKRGEKKSVKRIGVGSYTIWKYEGKAPDGFTTRSGSEQRGASWIIYRLADVLLMKAEAYSQLGMYNEALDILTLIHERAGFTTPVVVSNSPEAFEDRILEERMLELAFEGKRWFDLMRMGRRNSFSRKAKFIELVVENYSSSQKRILTTKLANPLGWYLPIYKGEIERNHNLVQNPYYQTNN